jgi:hypothetical protein
VVADVDGDGDGDDREWVIMDPPSTEIVTRMQERT